MDRWFVQRLQAWIEKHAFGHTAAVFLARSGYLVYILFGLLQWLRPGSPGEQLHRRRSLMEALLAVLVSSMASFCIGRLWRRHRPFVAHQELRQVIRHEANASFPSNHTMNAFAAALAIFHRQCLPGVLLIIWSTLIGLSRVACGLHYLTDILGGMLVGSLGYALSRRIWPMRLVSVLIPVFWKKWMKR